LSEVAKRNNTPFQVIGRVSSDQFRIKVKGVDVADSTVEKLESAWRSALPQKLKAQVMVAGRE
jgi:hypothetical protein